MSWRTPQAFPRDQPRGRVARVRLLLSYGRSMHLLDFLPAKQLMRSSTFRGRRRPQTSRGRTVQSLQSSKISGPARSSEGVFELIECIQGAQVDQIQIGNIGRYLSVAIQCKGNFCFHHRKVGRLRSTWSAHRGV